MTDYKNIESLNNYYFTYSDSVHHPYHGGWTEVSAPTLTKARRKFERVHGFDYEGRQRYDFVYTEDWMWSHGVFTDGIMGRFCHEVI